MGVGPRVIQVGLMIVTCTLVDHDVLEVQDLRVELHRSTFLLVEPTVQVWYPSLPHINLISLLVLVLNLREIVGGGEVKSGGEENYLIETEDDESNERGCSTPSRWSGCY